MKSEVEIQTDKAEQIKKVTNPSLRTDERVSYNLEAKSGELDIQAETETLGVLRGCSDTVFRLTMLAKKLYYR